MRRLFQRKPRCTYCHRVLEHPSSRSRVAATRDHVVPKHRGGTRTVPCCRQCNQLKRNMMPGEWKAFMERHPKWWKLFPHIGKLGGAA